MSSFEEIVRSAIKESSAVIPPALLAERVFFAIEKKKRFYVSVKLAVYSAIATVSFVGCVLIWQAEWPNIVNSEAVKLLSLLFSDFSVITNYWQEYAFSLLESLPVVSIIAVAAFVWAACASVWMTARTYKIFIHLNIKHV